MPDPQFHYRRAETGDAEHLARFINIAGEGLPYYLWQKMAEPGEDAWSVGRRRACREEGGFSYRNAHLALLGDDAAACLIGYPLDPVPEEIGGGVPAMFVPLMELENLARGSWYINVLATYPEFRGRGLGSRLLDIATDEADRHRNSGLSLIVSDANDGAIRLYERRGFRRLAARPMVRENWDNPGQNWLLMVSSQAGESG